jgi:hypothetical protein
MLDQKIEYSDRACSEKLQTSAPVGAFGKKWISKNGLRAGISFLAVLEIAGPSIAEQQAI